MNTEVNRDLRELSVKVLNQVADGAHLLRSKIESSVGVSENKSRENFQVVTEGLKELGILNIMPTSLNEDVFFVTKEWEELFANKNVIEILSSIPWIIPSKENPNWDKAFDNLVKVAKDMGGNPQKVTGIIDSNYDRLKQLIDSLSDDEKYKFYVSLQDQMEQEALFTDRK